MDILKGNDVVTLQAQLATITDNDVVFIVVNGVEVYYDGENLYEPCYPMDKKIEWSAVTYYSYAQMDFEEIPTGITDYNPAVILMVDWYLNSGEEKDLA